jgi:hypothetical protein
VGVIFDLLPLFATAVISFACGYGIREWMARRRRATAREKFYRDHPDLRRLRGIQHFAGFCAVSGVESGGEGGIVRLQCSRPQ